MTDADYAKAIQAAVRARYQEIRACYQRALDANASVSGTVELYFEIAADGRIFSTVITRASIPDPLTQGCFRDAVRTLKLPPPPGGPRNVRYPVTFSPGD